MSPFSQHDWAVDAGSLGSDWRPKKELNEELNEELSEELSGMINNPNEKNITWKNTLTKIDFYKTGLIDWNCDALAVNAILLVIVSECNATNQGDKGHDYLNGWSPESDEIGEVQFIPSYIVSEASG